MACWRRLHLQFRHRWMSGRTSKSSNGRKIARMARNSTIFGPNESSRRHLFLEKKSKSRNNRKVFEKLRKIFEIFFEKFFERCNLMGDVILSKTSLRICRLTKLSQISGLGLGAPLPPHYTPDDFVWLLLSAPPPPPPSQSQTQSGEFNLKRFYEYLHRDKLNIEFILYHCQAQSFPNSK